MIGTLVSLSWPVVVFWLFANRQPAMALCCAVLGGYLLLPGNFYIDLPAVPTFNKNSISALSALLAIMILVKGPRLQALAPGMVLPGVMPRSRSVRILLTLIFLGAFGTVLTNGDVLRYANRTLSALQPYDAAALVGNTLFALLPFLLARKFLAHPDAQRTLLVMMAMAGLLYSVLILYEVRMSPQLSRIVYGYFPHSWIQHIRGGGYRPVVFLSHGLWLAIFVCATFLGALSLWRFSQGPQRVRWLLAAVWLFMTLVLSKGMGSLGIGIVIGAMIVFLPVRLQILGAAVIAGVVLVYPMLRGAGIVPTGRIVDFVQSIDTDRANSLSFRLVNEDILLEKANDRPLFGWGTWGRNRVFDQDGKDISTTDGYWVMAIGTGGWIGYIGEFGILTLPLIFMALRWKSMGLTPATAGIALMLTANLVDLIPNATLTPVTWLLAGALAGRLELGQVSDAVVPADGTGSALPLRRNAYSRQRVHSPAHGPDPLIAQAQRFR